MISMEMDNIVDACMEKIVPLLANVKLPANQQGVVNPAFIAQLAVTQRVMQVQMDLEIFKLTQMWEFLAEHPKPIPRLDRPDALWQWKEGLCKYLHKGLEEHTDNIIGALQQSQKQEQSKIILPGTGVQQKITRPL